MEVCEGCGGVVVKMEKEGEMVCVECGLVKESRMMEEEIWGWGREEGARERCSARERCDVDVDVEEEAGKVARALGRGPGELDRGVMERAKGMEGMRSGRMLAAMVVCVSKLGGMREVARAAGVSESGLRKGIRDMQRPCRDRDPEAVTQGPCRGGVKMCKDCDPEAVQRP